MESPVQKNSFATIAQNFSTILETNRAFSVDRIRADMSQVSHIQDDALKRVFPAFQDLDKAISGLNHQIGDIVKRQSLECLQDYKDQMIAAKKELLEMKRKYIEFMSRPEGVDHTTEIRKQLTAQKEEAIRLDREVVKRDKAIKELKMKVKTLEEENKFLNEYIIINVKRNKLINLDRHIKPSKSFNSSSRIAAPPSQRETVGPRGIIDEFKILDLSLEHEKTDIFKLSKITRESKEQDLNNIHFQTGLVQLDDFLNELKTKDFGDKFRILKEVENFCKSIVISCERKFQDMKKTMSREKVRLNGLINCKVLAKAELTDIFEDCFLKVRGLIEKRKRDSLKSARENGESAERKIAEVARSMKIDYNNFMIQDKEKLLELFTADDTVLKLIKYLISEDGSPSSLEAVNRRQNQSAEPTEVLRTEASETLGEPRSSTREPRSSSRERPRKLNHNVRSTNLKMMPFNLPQIYENQKVEMDQDIEKDDDRRTIVKIEKILGMVHGNREGSQTRAKDVLKNYKI